jgi:hypothetical protein
METVRVRRFGSRAVAILLLVMFTATVVVTSTVSLGRYCLTSDGGDLRELAGRLP